MELRTCSKCKTEKPLTEFHKNKGKKDGIRDYCKCCAKSYKKAWREANREKLNAKNKAYREANREKIKAQKKAYHEANREKIRAYRETNREKIKAYREANREKIRAYGKAYYQTPRGKLSLYKSHAKQRGIEFLLTEEQGIEIIKKSCTYCGKPGPSGIDRIDSNGVYTIENCEPCCGTCNNRKGTKSKEVFLQEIKEGKWN